jgi:O-antigen/teichoic acid export membrane protein
LVNIVLSFALIYRYGFAGAVVGTSASLIVSAGYFFVVFHRQTKYSLLRLLGESYVKPLVCSLLSLAFVSMVYSTKDSSWLGLAMFAMTFGAMYCALILFSQFFDAYDWNKIEAFVPVLRRVRRLARYA